MSAAAAVITPFGTPERQPDQSFFVPYTTPLKLKIRVTLNAEGVKPTLEYQSVFQTIQSRILNELVSNRQLYKSPPTLESLQYMTSAWGFVKISGGAGGDIQMAKSMIIQNNIPVSKWPCICDFALIGLKISRSLIQPVFDLIYVEPVKTAESIIDFDWGLDTAAEDGDELEEVSDVSFMATSGGLMSIKDPAAIAREKAEAKERVREAYRAAEVARQAANTLASQFYSVYDVSDTESAFSEWADLDSEDDDSR